MRVRGAVWIVREGWEDAVSEHPQPRSTSSFTSIARYDRQPHRATGPTARAQNTRRKPLDTKRIRTGTLANASKVAMHEGESRALI
jgi:hypothetical protein